MRKILGDNFCGETKYKLYRSVYEIIHPTISKKNISNYKVILDEKLLPVLIFYPKRVSDIDSVIICVVGDGSVSGSYGKYADVCSRIAKESNKLVIAIDYFVSKVKYPTTVNKVYKIIKFLYEELNKNNIDNDKIVLMGDSTGCKILGSTVVKLFSNSIMVDKIIMFYPIVKDDYTDYKWNDSCMNINFNLDKKVNSYLKKYISKNSLVSCDLLEMVYFKDFPKTLVVTGDMDIFRDEGCLLAEEISKHVDGCKYINIKFASHGFLTCNDETIVKEAYDAIVNFVM